MTRRAALLTFVLALGAVSPPASGAGSAMDRLANALFAQLDEALGALPAGGRHVDLGFYVRLGSSARALGPGRGEKLATALIELAAGRYGGTTVASLDVATGADVPDVAAAGGRGIDAALLLEVEVVENYVILTGNMTWTDTTPWVHAPEAPPVLAKLFVRERLDAELRFYLGAIPSRPGSGELRMDVFAFSAGDVLAITMADIDGEGDAELVLLERHRLRLLRWSAVELDAKPPDEKGTKGPRSAVPLRVLAAASLDALPRAARSSREPVGTVLVAALETGGDTGILLRSSDLAEAHLYKLEAGTLVRSRALPLWPLAVAPSKIGGELILMTGELEGGSTLFAPRLKKRFWPDGEATSIPTRKPFVALVRRQVSAAEGPRAVTAIIDATGHLTLEEGTARHAFSERVGYAVDLGDLDDDGRVDVAVASASLPGEPDEIRVLTLTGAGLKESWRSGAIDGEVRALTIGDIDHDGRNDVIVISRTFDGALQLAVISRR